MSTYVWLLVGYPFLVLTHFLVCLISWLLVFTIPVSKMSAKTLHSILLTNPENIYISQATEVKEAYIYKNHMKSRNHMVFVFVNPIYFYFIKLISHSCVLYLL